MFSASRRNHLFGASSLRSLSKLLKRNLSNEARTKSAPIKDQTKRPRRYEAFLFMAVREGFEPSIPD